MDKHLEEAGNYNDKPSEIECKTCKCKINYSELESSKQPDGTYICPACQHNIDAEKHREEMGRD